MQVTSACCIVHANGGGVVLTLCNLHWWSVFFPKAVAHILNACIVICAVVVEVVAVVVVVVGRNIVTCTV